MLNHDIYVEAFKSALTFRGRTIEDLIKEVESVLSEFYTLFPKDNLKNLTFEKYVLGLPSSKDSYSYWLEFKTKDNVGSISGGSADKFGIYYSKEKQNIHVINKYRKESVEYSMKYISSLLDELIYFAENDNFNAIDQSPLSNTLKFKTLFMYFPEKFIPIFSENHYDYLLKQLGIYNKSIKGIAKKQKQLIDYKLNTPELEEFSNYELAHYLYYLFGVPNFGMGKMKFSTSGILQTTPIQSKSKVVKIREISTRSINENSSNKNGLKKKDYIKETTMKMKTGYSGEQLVMDYEVRRLAKFGLSNKIQHVSLIDDSKGYDILSFEEDGSERYIEVKTTKNQAMNKGSFYISENERKCAEGKNYWIYYVTGVDGESPVINLIEGPIESQQLHLTPVSYRVTFEIEEKE